MKIMLTSFGIGQTFTEEEKKRSIFYQMPPVSFRIVKETFMPDYDLLLLCDKLVMDELSFHNLIDHPVHAYKQVAETMNALNTEGYIELADYSKLLNSNSELLNRMVDQDIYSIDQWINPLKESLSIWRHFLNNSMKIFHEDESGLLQYLFHDEPLHYQRGYAQDTTDAKWYSSSDISMLVDEALKFSAKRKHKENREALRDVLRAYLGYINTNLILSNELQVGFHDWIDLMPFYGAKFMSVGKANDPLQEKRKEVENLFTIPFPELAIRDTHSLLKALDDKRIVDLRQLINDSVEGKVHFDQQFTKEVLSEVLHIERKVKRWRNITGYITLPLEFIPWVGSVTEKIVGETVSTIIEKKIKNPYRWFYLLSEIADETNEK